MNPTAFFGESSVTFERPIGDTNNSPEVKNKYPTNRNVQPGWSVS